MKKSDISKLMAEMGRRGGKKRLTAISPERRSEIAKKAALTRWKDKEPKAAKTREEPLSPAQSQKLLKKAATPAWKNKTTGAKKV